MTCKRPLWQESGSILGSLVAGLQHQGVCCSLHILGTSVHLQIVHSGSCGWWCGLLAASGGAGGGGAQAPTRSQGGDTGAGWRRPSVSPGHPPHRRTMPCTGAPTMHQGGSSPTPPPPPVESSWHHAPPLMIPL